MRGFIRAIFRSTPGPSLAFYPHEDNTSEFCTCTHAHHQPVFGTDESDGSSLCSYQFRGTMGVPMLGENVATSRWSSRDSPATRRARWWHCMIDPYSPPYQREAKARGLVSPCKKIKIPRSVAERFYRKYGYMDYAFYRQIYSKPS
jgi:hypothetical protein